MTTSRQQIRRLYETQSLPFAPERIRQRLHDSTRSPGDDWVAVVSSNLEAVRYNRAENYLEVLFLPRNPPARHRHYLYRDVPWSVFWGLVEAPSKGAWHHQNIKGRFRFETVD